ncbi:hypothetical protein ES703_105709 [subsurface metagenome]
MGDVRAEAEAHWEYTDKIIQDMIRLVKTVYIEVFIHAHKHGKESADSE